MKFVKKKLRVLHLASFSGNIGDIANHAGTRWLFQNYIDFDLIFTELEIREFYWKKRVFDDEFIRWANSFDLFIIGGGNYFELWVESSATGTSIDITGSRLDNLAVPTIFYSLGVDIGQGYSDQAVKKFNNFIQKILESKNMFVCVRNDGSSRALEMVLDGPQAKKIPVMPDGGFFAYRSLGLTHSSLENNRKVSINIAGDMLEKRFKVDFPPKEFLKEFSKLCIGLLDAHQDLIIEFVPHIWKDVGITSELLSLVPDSYLRRRIKIAALNPTRTGLLEFIKGYSFSNLVLGMRFHANVCPISMDIPTRGLLSYPQVKLLYEELELSEQLQSVQHSGFGAILLDQSLNDLNSFDSLQSQNRTINAKLLNNASNVLKSINQWLIQCL